jgi:hypothetical protein
MDCQILYLTHPSTNGAQTWLAAGDAEFCWLQLLFFNKFTCFYACIRRIYCLSSYNFHSYLGNKNAPLPNLSAYASICPARTPKKYEYQSFTQGKYASPA